MFGKLNLYFAALLFFAMVLSVSPLRSEHACNGTQTEPAGTSGSIELRGNCSITLTQIPGRINIDGVSNRTQCAEVLHIFIDGQQYCAEKAVSDIVFEVTDSTLVISAKQASLFPLKYYHGEVFVQIEGL